jgi:hypothetical protein
MQQIFEFVYSLAGRLRETTNTGKDCTQESASSKDRLKDVSGRIRFESLRPRWLASIPDPTSGLIPLSMNSPIVAIPDRT